jgi:hypothetical protein
MQHGIICPVKWLEKFAIQSKFHLILPHLFEKYPQYKEFYKERAKKGDHILIDNSIFELEKSFDYKKILEYAEEIGAKEVSAPEVLKDKEASKKLRDEFLNYYNKSGSKVNILAVAQGNNIIEIIESYAELMEVNEIKALGLPFDIDEEITGISDKVKSLTLRRVFNRWFIVDQISKMYFYKEPKPTHLMGLSDALELQKYSKYSWIRSNDSSTAFVHGVNKIRYTDKGLPCEKIKQKLDFGGYQSLNQQQIDDINYNINKILKWIQ